MLWSIGQAFTEPSEFVKLQPLVGMLQQMLIERLQPFDGMPRSFRTFTSIGTTCFAVVSMSIGTTWTLRPAFHSKRPELNELAQNTFFHINFNKNSTFHAS